MRWVYCLMSHAQSLRAEVEAHRWYHTIDLGHGLVTSGVDNTAERLPRLQLPQSLEGRSVLDIGAWDGFFSFECERRGAARVVASDWYSWRSPEGWGTKRGFELARQALESRVEDVEIDVLDLAPDRVGTFDVVLFLGVLYHLPDPLLALKRVASVAADLLILETVVDMVGIGRPAAAFYPGTELNDDPTNWWGFNPPAVRGLLRMLGFEHVATVTPQRGAAYRAARAVYHRMKGKNTLAAAYRQDRMCFHARRQDRPRPA